MDMRVRSLLGSVIWSLANALMRLRGSDSFFSTLSTPSPPGMMRTSYSLRSSWAVERSMSALMVKPEEEVTPWEGAAKVHSKALVSVACQC